MVKHNIGNLVYESWDETPENFGGVELDESVVMPTVSRGLSESRII